MRFAVTEDVHNERFPTGDQSPRRVDALRGSAATITVARYQDDD